MSIRKTPSKGRADSKYIRDLNKEESEISSKILNPTRQKETSKDLQHVASDKGNVVLWSVEGEDQEAKYELLKFLLYSLIGFYPFFSCFKSEYRYVNTC